MAQLVAGSAGPVNFDTLRLADLVAGTASSLSPTQLRIGTDAGNYRVFTVGFLDYSGGRFISGSVNGITAYRSGVMHFELSPFAIPAATFQAYVDAGDTAGFLAAVLSGNDTLSGNAYNAFDDVLDGFEGNDQISGGLGNDTLRGGAGNDTLHGEGGTDSMIGGNGNDIYYVTDSTDVANESGTTGDDTVISSAHVYTLGAGIETLTFYMVTKGTQGFGNELGNRITGGAYNDLLVGNGGKDTIQGDEGNDTIQGGTQVDTLYGEEGNDSLIGGEDIDWLNGGTGNDTMEGGTGDDHYTVDSMADLITEAAGAGIDDVSATGSYILAPNVENLTLLTVSTPSNWNATGNALNNNLFGNSGNNVLDGLTGADVMGGLAGNDTYIVDNTGDVVLEGNLDGKSGTFKDHGGYDTVNSSISFNLTADGVKVVGMVEALTLTGTAAINGTGNLLDNLITGNGAANTLTGLGGNDRLNGGAGADKMIGGMGNDTYVIDSALDVVIDDGGDKYDAVQASITVDLNVIGSGQIEDAYLTGTAAINAIGNGAGNLMMGNTGDNKLTGGAGEDTLYGADGKDNLDGGADADVLLGGNGDDSYNVGSGDTVNEIGGSGTDTVFASVNFNLASCKGNVENLTLLAGAGDIYAIGNTLANVITGNEGNNLIIGGQGDDTFNNPAGSGNDLIAYTSVLDGHDVIIGFDGDPDATGGQDTLNLDWLFDSLGVATDSRLARVQVTDRGLAVDIKVDTNGDATFDLFVATITTASTIEKGTEVVVGTL